MKPLSKRQQAVLDYIIQYIDANSYPPSMREIGRDLEIKSTNGVNDHIDTLCEKGFLEKTGQRSRALKVTPLGLENRSPSLETSEGMVDKSYVVQIPLLGQVTAGNFSYAYQEHREIFKIDSYFLQNQINSFALKILGDSMIGAGINDGDIVFVKSTSQANNGDIVIVQIDDEATCKRYFNERDYIRLQPENARLPPIIIMKTEAVQPKIMGIVTGLYRPIY